MNWVGTDQQFLREVELNCPTGLNRAVATLRRPSRLTIKLAFLIPSENR